MLKHIFICVMAFLLLVLPAACKKKEAAPKKNKIRTTLTVHVEPADAQFVIKGKQFKPGTKIGLKAGNYTILAEKDGYIPAWRNIDVDADEQKVVNIKLEPAMSTALFTSPDRGVRISLTRADGAVEAGSAPLYVPNLPAGEYTLKAEKPGHTTQNSTFVIDQKGMTVLKVIELDNTIGYLELKLKPADTDVVVYINDKERAFNGQRLPLAEGKYSVRVEKKGYAPQRADEVEIKRTQTTVQEFELRQNPAKLSIVVKGHPDAVVKVNGEEINSPEKWQEVPAGEYKIQVSKQFYDQVEKTLTLEPEQQEQVVIHELHRNTGSIRLKLEYPGVVISMNGRVIGATQPGANNGVQDFLIEGLAVGEKYKFTFTHPYQFKAVSRTISIEKDDKHKVAEIKNFIVANATLKYKNGSNRISGRVFVKKLSDTELNVTIPTKSGKGAYSEDIMSNEVIIDYLPEAKSDPKYNYSTFDFLAPVKE